MSSLLQRPTTPAIGRNAVIVGSVVAVHGVALWALNSGLLRPAAELIVPVQILAELVAPPPPPPPPPVAPKVIQPPPAPKPAERQRVAPAPPRPATAPKPAPAPQVLSAQQAEPSVPTVTAAEPAPVQPPTPPAPPPAPPAPPAPAVVVQPSSRAAHLNNAPPPYPAMSRRLGESGRVVLRVLIGIDGRAQEVRVQRSSGFERLDELALETARDRWRYVPGTRNGVPEPMWATVPIDFVLN